jgi:predicted transcriptional regulator
MLSLDEIRRRLKNPQAPLKEIASQSRLSRFSVYRVRDGSTVPSSKTWQKLSDYFEAVDRESEQ